MLARVPTPTAANHSLPSLNTSAQLGLYARQLNERVVVSDRLRVSGRPRISYLQEPASLVARRRSRHVSRRRQQRYLQRSGSAVLPQLDEQASTELLAHSMEDLPSLRKKSRPPALMHPSEDGEEGALEHPEHTPISLRAATRAMTFAGHMSNIAARNMLHVRGVGQGEQDASGVGQYENESALRAVFSDYGDVRAISIRHRIESNNNTSWALVTMADNASAARVLEAAQVKIGKYRLTINSFSRRMAKESTGAMQRISVDHEASYFEKMEAVAKSRLLVKQGRDLLMQGLEMQFVLQQPAADSVPETPVTPAAHEAQTLERDRMQKISLWNQAAKTFHRALGLDPGNMKARAGSQQAQRLLHEDMQRQKTIERVKLFRKCYGSDWRSMISLEQDNVTEGQLRKMFDMVDQDNSGHLDVDEVETLINFFGGGKQISPRGVRDAMLDMDEDNSGEVDFEEFKNWWENRKQPRSTSSSNQKLAKTTTSADDESPLEPSRLRANTLNYESKIQQLFKGYAANSEDREIDATGLHKLMTELGHNISLNQAVDLLSEIDEDGSGSIDFKEFYDMLEGRSSAGGDLVDKLRESAITQVDAAERGMWARGVFLRFPSGVYRPVFSMEARDKAINRMGAEDTFFVDPRVKQKAN